MGEQGLTCLKVMEVPLNAGELSVATLTCPVCHHRERERIPTDACLYFYVCKGCQTLLKPKKGDCCVFCSYADRCCPYC